MNEFKGPVISRFVLPLLALALSACASSPELGDDGEESAATRAAAVNTQLGTEYLNRGQYEVALEKLKKAIRSDKNFAPAHTVLGVLYEQLGEEELAHTHYRRALDITPRDGEVNNNYGAYLCRNGRMNEAQPYFEKALEDPFYPTPAVAMANAGQCSLDAGELDKAEAYLRKSLEYNAQNPDALLPLAAVAFRKQDFMRARAFIQRYEGVGPVTPESLELGYRIESGLDNDKNAREYRKRLLQQFPNSRQAQDVKNGNRT